MRSSPLHRLLPLALLLVAGIAFGDEAAPRWGTIDARAERLGRYVFVAERRPADGRLTVPPGFPQVVRAVTADAGLDLAVELDADATSVAILVPPAWKGGRVNVETAEQTRQFDDGRIVLSAGEARVAGGHAKLESQPGNHRIGFWTAAADTVSWSWKPTRWGAYDVFLTFSTAAPDGTEIEVAVGQTTLTGRLASTGSWYRYVALPLGRVMIPAGGDLPVTVRCTKLVGPAVMNLKALTLVPACEGTPPVQADDGVVTLHGRDATVLGTSLRYEPAPNKQTLGFWTRPTDAAAWTFTVRTPGRYTVEVLQGCGGGQGGSEMTVDVDAGGPGAATLEFTVQDTGGFQSFRPREVGVVTLGAGAHELRVAPKRIAKAAACDIRQIRLVPAAP